MFLNIFCHIYNKYWFNLPKFHILIVSYYLKNIAIKFGIFKIVI